MLNKLKLYMSSETDPFVNLASEEYLLNNMRQGECILFLWQNKNTVVIGKNQNAMRECRYEKMQRDGITLARRLSGGGAVFHDLGNLNFTFMSMKDDYDVSRQLNVIINAVGKFGIRAEKTGRNDITAGEKKFSGNAFFKSGDRCCHHGTILINADEDKLSEYLTPSEAKIKSKGVESVKSRIINLSELSEEISVDGMKDALCNAFSEVYKMKFKTEELLTKELLAEEKEFGDLVEKFSSWEWRFGRLGDFDFTYETRFEWGEFQLAIKAEKGIITESELYTDAMSPDISEVISSSLEGCIFDEGEMTKRLKDLIVCSEVAGDSDNNDFETKAEMVRDIIDFISGNPGR